MDKWRSIPVNALYIKIIYALLALAPLSIQSKGQSYAVIGQSLSRDSSAYQYMERKKSEDRYISQSINGVPYKPERLSIAFDSCIAFDPFRVSKLHFLNGLDDSKAHLNELTFSRMNFTSLLLSEVAHVDKMFFQICSIEKANVYNVVNPLTLQFVQTNFKDFSISHSKFNMLSIQHCATDTFTCKKSMIDTVTIRDEVFANHVEFSQMTVKLIDIKDLKAYQDGGQYTLSFKASKFNEGGVIDFGEGARKITIDYCIIGGHFYLENLPGTVEFINNLDIANVIDLRNAVRGNKVCHINLRGSSLSNLQIDYDHFKLYFDSTATYSDTISVYERLLEELKTERYKPDVNYMKFDVDFKKIGYIHEGRTILGFMDNVWWYYGYRKYYIFYWTVVFLVCFFILNTIVWNNLTSTYVIGYSTKRPKFYRNRFYLKQWVRFLLDVMIYTILIFFSLKIDFNKLSLKRRGYVLIFLVEYAMGLGCLFFIVNFIFRS